MVVSDASNAAKYFGNLLAVGSLPSILVQEDCQVGSLAVALGAMAWEGQRAGNGG